MATIKDLSFRAAMVSPVPVQDEEDHNFPYDPLPPYHPTVTMRPEIGMQIDVYHYRTHIDDHRDDAVPSHLDKSLNVFDGAQYGGTGTITAIHYKPGQSGTLYPYVDVEMEGD